MLRVIFSNQNIINYGTFILNRRRITGLEGKEIRVIFSLLALILNFFKNTTKSINLKIKTLTLGLHKIFHYQKQNLIKTYLFINRNCLLDLIEIRLKFLKKKNQMNKSIYFIFLKMKR